MSGEQIPQGSPRDDPPIEDVLASIRRVLSEDKLPPATGIKPPTGQPHQEEIDDGVLVLEPSMMAPDTTPERRRTAGEGHPAAAMNAEDMQRLWLWEQAAVRDHLARLEHKLDVLGSIAAAAAGTPRGQDGLRRLRTWRAPGRPRHACLPSRRCSAGR